MVSDNFVVLESNTMKGGNPNRDPLNGQFTSGDTGVSRSTMFRLREHREALKERGERRQPSSGILILPEQVARQNKQSVNDNLDINTDAGLDQASKETGGSRVFNFSTGEGSDLDKNVKLITNTNKDGEFERGTLRIVIEDGDTQKRTIHTREMLQLPQLVKQLREKKYKATGQHRRNTQYVMKASGTKEWGLNEQQANEQGTLRTLLISKVHHAYTTACDQLSMRGYLSQEQRMKVTSAFGAALKYLNESLDSDVAALKINNSDLADIANTMKADVQFRHIGGKVIPIGASKESNKSDKSESSQSQSDSTSLTQEQRQKIVNSLATKMGFKPDDFIVAENDLEADENGRPCAEYDPDTKKTTIYPEGFSKGREELIGTIAHEQSHANLDKVLDQYNTEFQQYKEGESLQNLNVFREMRPVFQESNRATYQVAGGQSKYGNQFWDKYKENPTPQNYLNAINESLAESNRLVVTGRESDVNPQFRALLTRVNNFAKGL